MPRRVPTPSRQLLEALVRKGVARGIPVQEAEDLVMEAWERASRAYDPARGSFDALLMTSAENAFRYWWRTRERARRRAAGVVPLHPPPTESSVLEEAARNQQRLLDALDEDERQVFLAWALQKALPRGRFTARDAAASLGLTVGAYDHARRRLDGRIRELLAEWGLEPRDFFSVDDHERPRRSRSDG